MMHLTMPIGFRKILWASDFLMANSLQILWISILAFCLAVLVTYRIRHLHYLSYINPEHPEPDYGILFALRRGLCAIPAFAMAILFLGYAIRFVRDLF